MAGLLVLVALLALGAARLGARVVDRARAQNAADAAALAAALQPDDAIAQHLAERVAERNDAELVDLHRVGTTTVVVVRVGHDRARAAGRPFVDRTGPTVPGRATPSRATPRSGAPGSSRAGP